MSTKPIVFKPTLSTPQGINNYSGATFRCFTRGDTLSFRFTFNDASGNPVDVTDWVVQVVIASKLDSTKSRCTDLDTAIIEVDIPLESLESATFAGEVTDEHTDYLPVGINYAIAKYVTATGATYIIDMAMLEIYPNLIESV